MLVPQLGFVLLFVASPQKSGDFYRRILGLEPVEDWPTFVMFALKNDVMLGLWSCDTVEPKAAALAGGSEICFSEPRVDELYQEWLRLGVPMVQEPTDMNFGRTFVALDPDGHRIRIYRMNVEQECTEKEC